MKKIYLKTILFLILTSTFSSRAAVFPIFLDGSSFTFNPANVTIDLGDTIVFTLTSGSHTTTSTSVPPGAATWNIPINNSNPAFMYVPTVAGVYNYQCTPHASMGMIGQFTVLNPSAINSPVQNSMFNFHSLNNSVYQAGFEISTSSIVKITLYDVTGKTVKVLANSYYTAGNYSETYVLGDLIPGIYLIQFISGKDRTTQRIIIN